MSSLTMETIMATRNRKLVPFLLAAVLAAATGRTAAQTVAVQSSVTGTTMDGSLEPVAFSGPVSISGRVIRDTDFGAPPVLELIVDLGGVKARGLHSGQAYEVESQTIVRRPLQSFEQVEVGISYAPKGDLMQARSAIASFGVRYSEAKGLTATPVKIEPNPPS